MQYQCPVFALLGAKVVISERFAIRTRNAFLSDIIVDGVGYPTASRGLMGRQLSLYDFRNARRSTHQNTYLLCLR